jgi:hypothetical protein
MVASPLKHRYGLFLIVMAAVLSHYFVNGIAISNAEDINLEDEAPAFTSIAQVEKAEKLAALNAGEPDAETIAARRDADQKERAYAEARRRLEALQADPARSPEEVNAAELAMETARKAYEEARAAADEKLADFAGVPVEDIVSMRQSGMGWGQIAHELGIHPSALGLGHGKEKGSGQQKSGPIGKSFQAADELGGMTSRNLKTGWSKGHGADLTSHSGGKGKGQNKGKAKSSGKGQGKGDGKGNGKKN